MSAAANPDPPQAQAELLRLRGELDAIDDALHDLLLRRAATVADVARFGGKGSVALRPGREAAIIRRLLGRHSGPLAPAAIVRVWRELLSGTTSLQGPYALAVCDPDPACSLTALAREHFGALVPLRAYRTAAQAIGELSAGSATAAIVPLPAESEPASAWWTALLQRDDPRIHIIARLPFWTSRPEGAPKLEAFVLGTVPPDPSGDDRSMLGLEIAPDHSRARLAQAFASAGLDAASFILRRSLDTASALLLVDVAGFVRDSDDRLAPLAAQMGGRPPVVLGAYAVPIGGDSPR